MRFISRQFFILIFTLILISCACTSNADEASIQIQEVQIDTLYSFLNFENHGIAHPTSVVFVKDVGIAVADYQTKKILIVDEEGNILSEFGKEGKGPGELVTASGLQVTNSHLNVIDGNQYKVLEFDFDGNFIDSYNYNSRSTGGTIAIRENRQYIAGVGGEDNHLLKFADANTDSLFLFGDAKGSLTEVFDMDAGRKAVQSGQIPDYFKNLVTIGLGHENLYAFLDSYSELRKYDMSGNLIWDKKIELPHNEEIFDQTIENSKRATRGLPILRYTIDLKVVNDEVFLLSSKLADTRQQIIKINNDGEISTIYTLPDPEAYFGSFAINPEANKLLITQVMGGDLFQTELP